MSGGTGPVLVLIRRPVDAVVSYVALQEQAGRRQNHRFRPLTDAEIRWRLREAMRYYVRFYERILALRKGFILAPFSTVTDDIGEVFRTLNACFSLQIPDYALSENERDKVFATARYHLAPNPERDKIKDRIVARLDPMLSDAMAMRAQQAYEDCLELAGKKVPE